MVGAALVGAGLALSGVAVGLSAVISVVALAVSLRVWGFVILRRRRRPRG